MRPDGSKKKWPAVRTWPFERKSAPEPSDDDADRQTTKPET
jgi:hypothetical protein